MKKIISPPIITVYILTTTSCFAAEMLADEQSKSSEIVKQLTELSLDELFNVDVTVGTRSKPRKSYDSPVAIDSYSAEMLKLNGSGDLTERLKYLLPSYNAMMRTGDGAAFIRSTTLRGLPPDDILLLVNGKRRHRSALIQHGGPSTTAGSHAADPGPIPAIALKNIEVLRDGAASQYGSDAIAGVLNFTLKDSDQGGELEAQWGEYYQGERIIKLAANIGLSVANKGFINLSAEYVDNEQLIRGVQPASAQIAIDSGIPNVGLDSPYSGDRLAQTWGRPKADGLRTAWNMGYSIDEHKQVYAFGNFADYSGNFRFFYRDPEHASLQAMPKDPNDLSQGNFCWCEQLPGGYTPYLVADITDFSNIFGVRGNFSSGMSYDFSTSFGMNKIDYTLFNTLNPSFGPNSPRDFDIGDLQEKDINVNADFSKRIYDNFNFAYGFEWREEKYIMFESQLEAWALGPWAEIGQLTDPNTGEFYSAPPIGSNGFSGTTSNGAGSFSRDNYAVYTDVEWHINEEILLQGALRFENFSDFGNTTNSKLAVRYQLFEQLILRGVVSTGFRAPTPGQSNYSGIRTSADGASGLLVQDGTVLPTSELAISLGGKALDAEKSKNLSFGFTSILDENFTLALDLYWIEVKDRIAKTIDIPIVDNPLFTRASFYTNALNSETKGVDIVAMYVKNWKNGASSQVNFAFNHNQSSITNQNQVNGINPVSDIAIFNIENTLPKNRFNLTVTHNFNNYWQIKGRANYFSQTIDERIEHEKISANTFIDIEVSYQQTKHTRWTLGASNLFDTYPSEIETRKANGLLYAQRSPLSYDGGMAYLRLSYDFDH